METLLERVEEREGRGVLRSNEVALTEIERQLDEGVLPDHLVAEMGLEPLDVVASLAWLGLGPAGSEGPTLVQHAPSRGGWREALSEPALARLAPEAGHPQRLALAAGLLQIHDFWDASHNAAQEADDLGERAVSAYWHGIGHRREPDPGNASYWFRRVGRHPIFEPLALRARDLIAAQGGPALEADRLVRDGAWDPFAFNEFCRTARPGHSSEGLARRLQGLEMAFLIGPTVEAVLGPG